MKVRSIIFVILLIIGIVFLSFNIRQTIDISLVFVSFTEVPTGIALLVAVFLGMIIGMVGGFADKIMASLKKKKKNPDEPAVPTKKLKKKSSKKAEAIPVVPEIEEPVPVPPKKKKSMFGLFKKKNK